MKNSCHITRQEKCHLIIEIYSGDSKKHNEALQFDSSTLQEDERLNYTKMSSDLQTSTMALQPPPHTYAWNSKYENKMFIY